MRVVRVCVCACGTVRAVRTERQAAGRAAESDGSADGWRRVCADVCVRRVWLLCDEFRRMERLRAMSAWWTWSVDARVVMHACGREPLDIETRSYL